VLCCLHLVAPAVSPSASAPNAAAASHAAPKAAAAAAAAPESCAAAYPAPADTAAAATLMTPAPPPGARARAAPAAAQQAGAPAQQAGAAAQVPFDQGAMTRAPASSAAADPAYSDTPAWRGDGHQQQRFAGMLEREYPKWHV